MKGYVYKRGNTYTYIVDVGKNKENGKRKQKSKGGFLRKKDAEAALRKILYEVDQNRYVEPSNEIFSSYIEHWFSSHYQKRVKETTISSRMYMMRKHLIRENPFSDKPISKVTTEDIDELYNIKIDQGYSTSTIRKIHQMLNKAFKQAAIWKRIATNPVINADPPSVKTEEMKIWSFNEINKFLAKCINTRHYITFLLAIYTGMRRGEILGLKWSDIDFDKKVIRVERQLAYIPKNKYILTTLKTKKSRRIIPISDNIVAALRTHKEQQQLWQSRLGKSYKDFDLVICKETGMPENPRNVLTDLKEAIESANVTSIRFHDIRHTHASILISEGVDIVKVSARLGHSNPKITYGIYAHLIPNDHNDVADIFHNAISRHNTIN